MPDNLPSRVHNRVLANRFAGVSLLAAMLITGGTFFAQGQTAVSTAQPSGATLDDTDLQQLVAPVALYPDPLLAEVFPACTYPTEIPSAAAWVSANPNPTDQQIAAQPYDPPVQALLRYPSVIQLLNGNMEWTQQLGSAFINQPTDVMNAVQALRQRAQAAGVLVSGPQVQVSSDPGGIEIYPADPNVIYVPQYDPDSLYVGVGATPLYIDYGVSYPAGVWLGYNFDWRNHYVGPGRGWNHGWPAYDSRRPPTIQPWRRNGARPVPVYRPTPGYGPPAGDRRPPSAFDPNRGPQPRSVPDQRPRPDARPIPDRAPAPDREPAPVPRPAPMPEQRPQPAPRPAFAPAPEAFHPENNGAAASDRGHASMGGGGGGGPRGGGGRR